jgi:predicted dehydrogenase
VSRRTTGIRVGVAGLGYWGAKHVKALRSLGDVQAVIGIDRRYRDHASPRFGADPGLKVYGDIKDALPEIDAVVVATPSSTHLDIAMAAIGAGRHVLIEKPMAVTVADARQLTYAAAASGVVLMVGHTFEYDAAVHKLREIVTNPEFGRLHYLHCARLNLGIYREDVNVIFDLATHDVSIANFILGIPPTTVTAWGSRHVDPHREDVAHVRLRYDDIGADVHIHVSWLDPIKVRRIVAAGTKRMAVYDGLQPRDQIQIFNRSALLSSAAGSSGPEIDYHHGEATSTHIPVTEPLITEDRHFIECIIDGRRPSTDGYNGLRVVRVLECAQISLQEKRAVLLSEIT